MAGRCRVAAALGCFGVVAWGLWRTGAVLGSPPLGSWERASAWYDEVGPTRAVVAAVRLVALALSGWLVLAAAAQLFVADGRVSPSTRWLADLIAPRSLQRLVHGLAGLSLSAGLAVTAPGAGIHGDPGSGVAVMRVLDEPPAPTGTATMHAAGDPAPPAAPALEPAPPATGTIVVSGDSLWSIAEDALRVAGHGDPRDQEVAGYWRRLIDANRSSLVAPSNPDLIYPGQHLTLPSP
jgi:LysM domain